MTNYPYKCIKPSINDPKKVKVLILGLFPSDMSIANNQYYYCCKNRFWDIVGPSFCIDVYDGYATKIKKLTKNGICLWDLIKDCSKTGNRYNDIKKYNLNNIKKFTNLKAIIINGERIPKKFKEKIKDIKCDVCVLPNTSGTNTHLSVKDKKKIWGKCLDEYV